MINTVNLPPFKKFCMTIGNLPSSFMESMTYYEALCWLYDYFEKTLIPAINTEGEAITELQEAFTTLKEYVDNYFENLDVQNEINNKLDDMADNGELASIINQFLEYNCVISFETVAEMVASEILAEGSICYVTGDTHNDAIDSHYIIRQLINTDVVDGVNIIALTNYPTLIAELIKSKKINDIEDDINNLQGDVSDLQTDVTNLQNAKLKTIGGILYVDDGQWKIMNTNNHTPVNIDSVSVDGNGNLIVNYTSLGATDIVDFTVTPDEHYSKYGVRCGASVGTTYASIELYTNNIAYAYFGYNNGQAVLNTDRSYLASAVTWNDTYHRMEITFDGGMNYTYANFWSGSIDFQSGNEVYSLKVRYQNQQTLYVYMFNGSTLVTDPTKFVGCMVMYGYGSKIDAAQLVSHPITSSNIWITGHFK